jgi:hypothetical protein
MRREYDFSQGLRGKHTKKRIRIVGDPRSVKGSDTAAKIQQLIERDLKSREHFNVVWSELDRAERESIRAAWLKKINAILADRPATPRRKPNGSGPL